MKIKYTMVIFAAGLAVGQQAPAPVKPPAPPVGQPVGQPGQIKPPAPAPLVIVAPDTVVLSMGNPQCILLDRLPDAERFLRLGAALERHPRFAEGTNVAFVQVDEPTTVRIAIWERGVGPTTSSGTGSCASLVAAAAFGGAARNADVIAPGGRQRVEWLEDNVYLTGWAEVLFDGDWLQ